ncbi:ABC transporter ATP-binding protein [Anaerosporobacter sp.]
MGSERITAVDDVSFDIYKGEFCCLLGTSGSGKSTLLNLMAGIEKLTSGQIIIKGKNIHKMSEKNLAKFRQKYLGFVFQSYNLMNSMTALENVEFPLVFKRIPSKRRKKMAREMLVKVGLKTRLAHKPKQMSGGQQQRVGIARAFVAKPDIVFADEPTGNLDTKTTMEVMNLIKEVARTNHQTIVMVTHDRRLAEFADKIINILDGKIQSIDYFNSEEKMDKENVNVAQVSDLNQENAEVEEKMEEEMKDVIHQSAGVAQSESTDERKMEEEIAVTTD